MTKNHQAGIAKSPFRQMRVCLTQETSGRISYSILAKPLTADWKELHTLVRGSIEYAEPIRSSEECYAVILDVIRAQMLPGIG